MSEDSSGRSAGPVADSADDKLFDLSIDMMCVAGTDGFFQRVNPAFEKVLGWTAEEMLTRPLIEFIHPEDRDDTIEALKVLGEGDQVIDFENRYLHRDGSHRWFQWRAVPAGVLVYAIARDVTEAKVEEGKRRRLEERMLQSQKLESLGLLAGGIAHDFNNLLSGILGHTQLAVLRLPPDSPARDEIDRIETAAVRASELCNQMLAYSGAGRSVTQPVRLSELVEEMMNLLEVSISKKVRLHLDLADDSPWVEGDISQIRQVVMNLITNASEAIGEHGGMIALSTGVTRTTVESLALFHFGKALDPGHYAFVEIADTGQGMDEATLKRIFDPFFTTKFTGRGLGLAAVLGIVRSHDGAIQVHTEPGRGTRFRILLPIREGLQPENESEVVSPPFSGHGKVIVADDDPNALEVTEQLLMYLGFEVLTAEDGVACLELFDLQPDEIQLVVLDLTMPRMDGQTTLKELQLRNDQIRVLMTSGYSQQSVVFPAASEGRIGFLQKPYRLKSLEESLQELLPELSA